MPVPPGGTAASRPTSHPRDVITGPQRSSRTPRDHPRSRGEHWKTDAAGASPQVAAFIKERWPDGEVIPAF